MIDFLCIGAQKAGTSWLMRNLSAHPSVWCPQFVKEVHFFDSIHLGYSKEHLLENFSKRIQKLTPPTGPKQNYYQRILDAEFAFTDEWYKHIFSPAPPTSVKGECTPLYSALPTEGINHIMRLSPAARFIYLVRDPFDRLASQIRMRMERRKISDHMAIYPLLEENSPFMMRGDYAQSIPRWDAAAKNSILYIAFGDIKSQPQEVMSRIEQHLSIPPFSGYPTLAQPVHVTRGKANPMPEELLGMMKRLTDPQRDFLKARFGQEFTERTK